MHMHIHIHVNIHIYIFMIYQHACTCTYTYLYTYETFADTLTNYDRPQWKAVFSQLAAQHEGEKVSPRRGREKLMRETRDRKGKVG